MYNRSRHPSANGNGHVENRDIEILMDMVANNVRSARLEWMRNLFDPRRNIADECGYPENGALGIEQYRFMWEREPIAARVVELMPRECWCVQPTVYEEEDADTVTAFEKAWDDLGKTLRGESSYKEEEGSPVWEYLKRADELSGIGSYGVILLGFDDRPANQWTEEVKKAKKLLYVRCLDERLAPISQWEDDPASPRYGQPKVYSITLADPTESSVGIGSPSNVTLDVHWSRVIHVADGLATNEVLGIPRQRPVFNRILDLYKLYGGSAEMHWKGAFNGIAWGTHPQLGGEVDIDPTAMRDQMEQYFNGQQKYLVGKGMTAQTLAPNVADPSPFIQVQLEAICIKLEVPMRIFMGSERGELASSQDEKGWKKRVSARQRNYITPRLIVPFVDRLIKVGILPKPADGYCVNWPDMFALSELEQADIGLKRTQALAAYTQGGCDTALPLDQFYTLFLGMEDEDATAIIDKLLEQSEDEDKSDQPDSPLLGLVGGMTGVLEAFKAAKAQELSEDQLRGFLKMFFRLGDDQIDELIADGIPEPEPEPVAPTLPMKVGEGQALIHPETGQTIGKGPPKTFPPKRVANKRSVKNVFCATGEGGGVDPSCSPGQARAKVGGEFGPNGEWYKGGAWIATTEMPKRERQKLETAAKGSVLVAPGVREVPPPGMMAAYDTLAPGVVLNPKTEELNMEYLAYQNSTEAEVQAYSKVLARYKSGDKFIPLSEHWQVSKYKDLARAAVAGYPIPEEAISRMAKYRGEDVEQLRSRLALKKWKPTSNVFCPTGEGGGVDPTCSPFGGEIGAAVGGRGLTSGKRIKFHEGEYAGMHGTITGQHAFETKGQYAAEKDNPSYKIQIDELPGGLGQTTIQHKSLSKMARLTDKPAPEIEVETKSIEIKQSNLSVRQFDNTLKKGMEGKAGDIVMKKAIIPAAKHIRDNQGSSIEDIAKAIGDSKPDRLGRALNLVPRNILSSQEGKWYLGEDLIGGKK